MIWGKDNKDRLHILLHTRDISEDSGNLAQTVIDLQYKMPIRGHERRKSWELVSAVACLKSRGFCTPTKRLAESGEE